MPRLLNRASLDEFFTKLCELVEMEKCEVYFWDDVDVPSEEQQTEAHTKGTSAVCFILTSTIVVHTLGPSGGCLCEYYFLASHLTRMKATKFTEKWFNGHVVKSTFIERT